MRVAIILLFLIISCTDKTDLQKAEASINSYMKINLHDYSGYDPVETRTIEISPYRGKPFLHRYRVNIKLGFSVMVESIFVFDSAMNNIEEYDYIDYYKWEQARLDSIQNSLKLKPDTISIDNL